MNHKYAQVIVDVPDLDTRTFSYLIPEGELAKELKPGVPVLVPFGNRGVVNAFVVGFSNYLPEGIRAKSIIEVLDDKPLLDIEYLQLLEWVANYYCCDVQTVIDAAIPQNLFSKSERMVKLVGCPSHTDNNNEQKILEFLAQKPTIKVNTLRKKVKLTYNAFYSTLRGLAKKGVIEISDVVEEKKSKPKLEKFVRVCDTHASQTLTSRQQAVVEALKELGGEAKLSEFLEYAKTTAATLKKIAQTGAIEIFEKESFRNPSNIFKDKDQSRFFQLTAKQQQALEKIIHAINNKAPEPMLLYGVTGSGKTEVYMHAVKHALENGKSVIILAPEIILASQLALRFSARFGNANVAIWHSSISDGEKHDVYQRIKNGEIKIIVGARSAIFAPVEDLGLIVIDEEHESSYKQTSPAPRYNAKTIAQQRASREGAALLLGTATPDITTFFRAKNSGNIIMLPERIGSAELAKVNVVDMRDEFLNNNKSIFSRALKKSLLDVIENKKQAILLINRRGFSTYGQCHNCGHTPKCKSCDIPLILHKTSNKLRCHYCNYEISVPEVCPSCQAQAIRYYGMGTQRVEELFKKEFPDIRVERIDSDIMAKKNTHIEILEEFSNGNIDVLIGTQMIAKGLDVPNVTLVGVISSDSLFNIPDFRGTERGFQLLTQVAGRAGRGDFRGKVYFQTYTPEFFGIHYAKEQDFLKFYERELISRDELAYPPFSNIIRFIVSSREEIKAIKYSTDFAYRLRLIAEQRGLTERLEVLGPSRCIITKIKDEYRFQVLVKNTLGENGHGLVSGFVKSLKAPKDIKFLTDVDPSDML